MNIAVLIKQVPETDNLIIDEKTGTVKRAGVDSIVNPLDLYALEASLRIKEKIQGSTVTVISMGPESAEKSLKEALSMGADKAVLLSDKAFAGSDTFATSYIISRSLKKLDNFDLILCGEKAVDGDTGQVGPEVAALLDMDIVSFVSGIKLENNYIIFERITESGFELIKAKKPVVAAITKAIGEPRLPTLAGKKRARITAVKRVNIEDLSLDSSYIGLNGSPTRVVKIHRPSLKRDPHIIFPKTENELHKAAQELIDFLEERGIIQQREK